MSDGDGKWGGFRFKATWREYRHGRSEKRPVYDPAQPSTSFPARQVPQLIADVTALLSEYTLSKFENEGPLRHAVRSSLCNEGKTWNFADDLSAYVVAEGLRSIGGEKRPTWEEGQPEHAARAEQCARCLVPLDDEQIAHGDRFCSGQCARAFIGDREARQVHHRGEVERSAWRATKLAVHRRKACACCGKSFRPRGNGMEAIYCSPACVGMVRRTVEERACECCGKVFRPANGEDAQRYCSQACWYADRATPRLTKDCDYCGGHYMAASKTSMFCSVACKKSAEAARRGEIRVRLLPHVFDHFVTREVDGRPPWLNPERFDELLAA